MIHIPVKLVIQTISKMLLVNVFIVHYQPVKSLWNHVSKIVTVVTLKIYVLGSQVLLKKSVITHNQPVKQLWNHVSKIVIVVTLKINVLGSLVLLKKSVIINQIT